LRRLAEPSGIGRWRRRATGVEDRWSPSRKGYRTRLTVRPRPTPRYRQPMRLGHSMLGQPRQNRTAFCGPHIAVWLVLRFLYPFGTIEVMARDYRIDWPSLARPKQGQGERGPERRWEGFSKGAPQPRMRAMVIPPDRTCENGSLDRRDVSPQLPRTPEAADGFTFAPDGGQGLPVPYAMRAARARATTTLASRR
jgi:hypothetical protein